MVAQPQHRVPAHPHLFPDRSGARHDLLQRERVVAGGDGGVGREDAGRPDPPDGFIEGDRKSTRLNSSHLGTSYAVFCLKKKKESTRILLLTYTARLTLFNEQCIGTH